MHCKSPIFRHTFTLKPTPTAPINHYDFSAHPPPVAVLDFSAPGPPPTTCTCTCSSSLVFCLFFLSCSSSDFNAHHHSPYHQQRAAAVVPSRRPPRYPHLHSLALISHIAPIPLFRVDPDCEPPQLTPRAQKARLPQPTAPSRSPKNRTTNRLCASITSIASVNDSFVCREHYLSASGNL